MSMVQIESPARPHEVVPLPDDGKDRTCSACWCARAVAWVRGRIACGPCGAEILNGGEPGWSQLWD